MNKIIFVTQPDIIQGTTFAIKNYVNADIKKILDSGNTTGLKMAHLQMLINDKKCW